MWEHLKSQLRVFNFLRRIIMHVLLVVYKAPPAATSTHRNTANLQRLGTRTFGVGRNGAIGGSAP